MLQFDDENERGAVIKVIGVGGAGNNAVNCMIDSGLQGVDFIAVNTDKQALGKNQSETKIQIGEKLTRGLGAGSNPEIGQRACEESIDEVIASIENADMVFITAGMGGGTGTGAAPIIAKAAKDKGILTVGVVTTPFKFETKRKMKQAELGLSFLKQYVDSLVVVPNQKLIETASEDTTMIEAFNMSNDVLRQGIAGISNLISEAAFVNVDFADVRTAMTDRGIAHMGMGKASGEGRAEAAVKMAIESPLLETKITGAKAVLLFINGGYDLGMLEVDKISNMISEQVADDCIFKFGAMIDPEKEGEISVTVIAAGFDNDGKSNALKEPEKKAEPENQPNKQKFGLDEEQPKVFNGVDGVDGEETTLQDILNKHEGEEDNHLFEVPKFLK